ncbi:MAG: hypothetical protein ACR2KT_02190 [Methylocella sp.]
MADVFEDSLKEKAILKGEFVTLKAYIGEYVPESLMIEGGPLLGTALVTEERLRQRLREAALKRIEKLNPDIFGPEASQTQALEKGRADKAAYQKALADQLKSLVCRPRDEIAAYIVRELMTVRNRMSRVAEAGPFAPGLVKSILAPSCPVSAALTDADKATLKKQAEKIQPSQSKQ